MKFREACVLLVLFLLVESAVGQAKELGSWNIVNVKYAFNNRWSAFGEAQLRSLKFYNHFHYHEIKGGLDFKTKYNLKLTIGGGNYQTYQEGGDFVLPKNNNEIRIWPQLSLTQSYGRINVEQRLRTEFRFTSNGYRNRFRYRLAIAYPFGKEKEDFRPFLIGFSSEIFLTDSQPYFERYRIQLALSYKPTRRTTIQIGYINQLDYRLNDEIGRDFLQIGYFLELFPNKENNPSLDMNTRDN